MSDMGLWCWLYVYAVVGQLFLGLLGLGTVLLTRELVDMMMSKAVLAR